MKIYFLAGTVFALAACVAWAEEEEVLQGERAKVSYSVGASIGSNLKRQGADVDLDLLIRGLKDSLSGDAPLLTEPQIRDVLMAYQQKLQTSREDLRKRLAEENRKKAAAFLEENKTKPGILTTESGLQYKVLNEGTGPTPGSNDILTVNYRGSLLDGAEFDSSYKRNQPWMAPANRGVKGWSEALHKMKQGDKWQLFLPPDLAYGDTPPPGAPIPPGSAIIFEVELVTNTPPPPPPAPLTSDIIKVPSLEEMKKGAKIETIKAEDLERLQQQMQEEKK